jgi:[ribosomal protein S5]-alanine N-acetyltransferase
MRCYLDAPLPRDKADLIRLLTDARVRTYLGGALSESLANSRVAVELANPTADASWAIRRNDDGVFLGSISLAKHHDGDDIEVSYALLPEHHGMGYATEALLLALAYGFREMNLQRIVAETQSANQRSIRLLERVGMQFEKHVIRFAAQQSIYVARFRAR